MYTAVSTMADQDDDSADPTAEDMIDAALDYEAQQRLWIRAIGELVARRPKVSDPSDRVQFALDMLFVAACERGVRILGNDVSRAGANVSDAAAPG